jgi:NADH-quinone oxidoreductase subunit H
VTNVLAVDPLLSGGIGLAEVLFVVAKGVVVLALLLVSVLFMIWFERKVHADMSNRIGPNRAGPWGMLQTLADGIKFFFKEDLLPDRADRKIFILAPFLSVVPAFLVFSVIPIGGDFNNGNDGAITIAHHTTWMQLADPPVGVLLILMCSSIAVYGVMLAGWSSGSKYPLLGSVRASAQMVSYEAALGMSVVMVVLMSGSLSTHSMVVTQAAEGWGILPRWNLIVTGVVPFVVFLIAATAEMNRPPFDLVEAEQELVGGTVTMSGIIVTLFLGGPSGPALFGPGWIWGSFWFLLKVLVFLFVFVWFRATLPRFRYDQLMDLGWKVLIPLALGWLLMLGAINVARDEGWNVALVVGIGFLALVAGYGLLATAMRTARERAELEGADA